MLAIHRPNMEENHSPLPRKLGTATMLSFSQAIDEIMAGKKVTRLEWDTNDEYCFEQGEMLSIYRNGKVHQWLVSRGDIEANDWYVMII